MAWPKQCRCNAETVPLQCRNSAVAVPRFFDFAFWESESPDGRINAVAVPTLAETVPLLYR
jgi:hypothetical protein